MAGRAVASQTSRLFTGRACSRCRFTLTLFLLTCLWSTLLLAENPVADDRVLQVRDGSTVRQYRVPELVAAIGLTKLSVEKDPNFQQDRIFAGLALKPLLTYLGLDDAQELLLVCEDGYHIPFDTSVLAQPELQGLLAIHDTEVRADSNARWLPYRHGAEDISFDPFYLVWASGDESIELGTETIPWPYQLTEIHRFDRAGYFAAAKPPDNAAEIIHKGFEVYTAHCAKCHRMRGVGGELGPELDRDSSLSSIFTEAQLSDFIRHDKSQFPQSKMPSFSAVLNPAEISQVTAYLKSMQPAK